MFQRRRHIKLNSAVLLQGNEIGETKGLVSCHVCIVQVKSFEKKHVIMSHYRVMDTDEHVSRIRHIFHNLNDIDGESLVDVLLFRLDPEKIIEHHASQGTIYHIDEYESATRLLKNKLVKIFRNVNIHEIPYDIKEKDGDWVRVNTRKGTWVGSFGKGSVKGVDVRIKC